MSNIEKLLNAMIQLKGDALVLAENQVPSVSIGESARGVTKAPLGARELALLESEWQSAFGGAESFVFNNKNIVLERSEAALIFRVGEVPEEQVSQGQPLDLRKLLHEMVEKGASDLHVSSECRPIMRIDGDMATLSDIAVVHEAELMAELKKIVPDEALLTFDETNDVDLAYAIPGLARFRTNIFRDQRGACVVFRVIPSRILTVDELNIPREVVDLTKLSKGLLLVTGPTGSGKSTTLASLVDHVNGNQKKHIITIEDPVEFVHENKASLVNQREVHSHTESFKKSLRAALREDPDVILVGEMRDLETIAIAIEMAVTGHLVFGTLHTSTAVGTVDRIVDQFPSDQQSQIRIMLADSLVGVVSQVLCKKKGGGRVAAYEVLIVTPSVSNLIREAKTFQIPSLMQTGKSIGMRLMNEALVDLVAKGIVEKSDAVARSTEPDDLIRTLKTKGLN